MLIALNIGIVLLLLLLAGQDFLYRKVSWIIFPLLVAFVVLQYGYKEGEVQPLFRQALFSGVFIATQLSILYLFLCVRKKAWIALTREYIGWGDILFFFTLAFFFSFFNFLLFYLISLISLVLFALLFGWAKSGGRHLPLAGWQAVCLIAVYGLDLFSEHFDVFRDEFLLSVFAGVGQYL